MTKQGKRGLLALAVAALLCLGTSPAWALTAQEIADSVIDELDNVNDYTASVDADFSDATIDDMTDGSFQWKRATGEKFKVKMSQGSPYTEVHTTDASNWNFDNGLTGESMEVEYWSYADGLVRIRFDSGADLFSAERILDDETWTKAASTETVNSVSCYKLYTTKDDSNYEVWIDEATVTKVIRVKATNADDVLEWQLDYSDYSDVEATAQLPATITAKAYDDDGTTVLWTVAHSFDSVDINEGLADSIFELEHVPE